MQNRFKEFQAWLETDLTHFVALVEEGSTVAGDSIQPGFSDHDLTIVVSQDVESEMQAVFNWLKQHPFDDTYLFGPRLAHEFLAGDSLNDISLKFRSKTVIGRDVVEEKKSPNREAAMKIGLEGLKGLEIVCMRRWLNLSHWSLDYCRKKNYEIFKSFFVLFAAKIYGETGHYPTKREDAANLIPQKDLALNILLVTNNIGKSTKEGQKLAFESALAIIRVL